MTAVHNHGTLERDRGWGGHRCNDVAARWSVIGAGAAHHLRNNQLPHVHVLLQHQCKCAAVHVRTRAIYDTTYDVRIRGGGVLEHALSQQCGGGVLEHALSQQCACTRCSVIVRTSAAAQAQYEPDAKIRVCGEDAVRARLGFLPTHYLTNLPIPTYRPNPLYPPTDQTNSPTN